MITGHENGFSVGDDRYGSRQNAAKCACGGPVNPRSRQPFMEPMCDECIAEEKQHAKGERDYERENADGKCYYCGHRPSSHTDGNGNKAACSICDCTGYGKPRENADPIARCENGRAVGQERYGSVQNAKPGLRYETTCPGCRHPVKGHDDDGCGNPECSCTKPRETMED